MASHESWEACRYAIRADLFRACGSPGFLAGAKQAARSPKSRLLIIVRLGAWSRHAGRPLLRVACGLVYERMSWRCGVEIPYSTSIGPGLRLSHRVGGVIVNSNAVIGSAVTLAPGVVVGNKTGCKEAPTIGDGVVVHTGAVVLGRVVIADHARIGAGSVVTSDVPSGCTAAGVPARVFGPDANLSTAYARMVAAIGEPPQAVKR